MFSIIKSNSAFKLLKSSCYKRLKHKSAKKTAEKSKKYTNTVLLPKTDFDLWLSSSQRIKQDERVIKECAFERLYSWQRENVKGPEFVLHDGPPYANGMPHMGHAINKVLKDITTRHKLVQGYCVHYKPGWDCHGLPIELKAMAGRDITSLTPLDIRGTARKYAKEAIRDQKAVFRSWGVMADWDEGCYLTFDKSYIKNQLEQFYKLYEQGMVYRDIKPVYWSPSSRTALAEAELEYREKHESMSAYVRLSVNGALDAWGTVYALVWTTTPWTLPANQAVAYSPSLSYSLVTLDEGVDRYIVASSTLEQLAATLPHKLSVICSIDANDLSSLRYKHPLDPSISLPLVPSDHVTASKGTGLVHIAPAHGPDDFKLAKKYNLPISSLVDEGGFYTADAGDQLAGKFVLTEGSQCVLELCKDSGAHVHSKKFQHSYPYDWRSGLPVILRASNQWFFDTSAVKNQAVEALIRVQVLPERGLPGLVAQVQTRPFWCISRQRVWGVPIPVLYSPSGEPIISRELVDHYCHLLDTVGEDFWWSCSNAELAPDTLLTNMNVRSEDVERGQDILDIWLDSGLSWSAVLDCPTADLYLEGVDQYNGWFQSSLLTSVALQQVAPYKTVFVHGFAVDENGMKMSKSLGNVVNPQDIVFGGSNPKTQPTYGVDTLRWWVAAHATQQSSVPVSETTLGDSKQSVHKLRSVFKFLLGGLHALPAHIPPPELRHLDFYMLHCLHAFEAQVTEYYNTYRYNHVCLTVMNFVANQVSALYCQSVKDRLYCEEENSVSRRAAQLTLYHILTTVTHAIAPILPVLAEEVYMHQPQTVSECLFHCVGPTTRAEWHNPQVDDVMGVALGVKQQVSKLTPLNSSNLELDAVVSAPMEQWRKLQCLQPEEESSLSELTEILQVSHITLRCLENAPEVKVEVKMTSGHLCGRCRRYTAPDPLSLCSRCTNVLTTLQ